MALKRQQSIHENIKPEIHISLNQVRLAFHDYVNQYEDEADYVDRLKAVDKIFIKSFSDKVYLYKISEKIMLAVENNFLLNSTEIAQLIINLLAEHIETKKSWNVDNFGYSSAREILTNIINCLYMGNQLTFSNRYPSDKYLQIYKCLLQLQDSINLNAKNIFKLLGNDEKTILLFRKMSEESQDESTKYFMFLSMMEKWKNPAMKPYAIFHVAMIYKDFTDDQWTNDEDRKLIKKSFSKVAIEFPELFDQLCKAEFKPELMDGWLTNEAKEVVANRKQGHLKFC